MGELGEDGGGGGGAGAADPFGVGVGSVAFWSVEHGGDACRGEEGRVGPVGHGGHGGAWSCGGEEGLDDGGVRGCLHRGAVQDGACVDGDPRVGGLASFDQAGDVGFEVFQGFSREGSPFDGEYAAVRDGGFSGAAADQGGVQVAGSKEGVGPAAELLVEVVECGQVVAGGEDGVGAEVGS